MDETSPVIGVATRSELIALAILVAGIIIARLASIGVGALLELMDRRAARVTMTEESMLSPGVIRVSRIFVFWVFVALAVLTSLRVLGVGGPSAIINTVLGFTPRIFVAFSIFVAGHLLGLIAAQLLSRLSDDVSPDSIGPRLLHIGILSVAVVMGLQHVNVDISFITRLFLILVGTVSGGLMLAFALGARQHVANLLARHELTRLAVGDRIRVDGIEGTIVDIYKTGIDVAVAEGIASIPAAKLTETGVTRLQAADHDG